MIKINLLGIREKPKKPIKRKEKKRKSPTKTISYIIILLFVIVVLFIPTYFPDLFNFISSKLKDKLIIPEKGIPPIDTTQKLAVKEEAQPEIEPEKPPEKDVPKPKPEITKPTLKTEDYLKMVYINNQREIGGFSALRGAVSKGIEYTLITVNEDYFISEIVADSKDEIAQYDINLKSRIPEGGIKIIGINETVETKKLTAQIWGYLDSYKGMLEKTEIPFNEFYKPSEIISKIRRIAKKNGFVIKSYTIQKAFEQGNFKKSPVLLKLQGYDENSINFLESLKKENLNFLIQKISGVPELDKKSVSIAISLEVFVPST
ncbi:MAG: hypothetical protein HWN67_10830 [Candidatus Helarchaeota archaeon]|nr:hypothetical protein [Candidatus Helarchaeota archaeon]